MRTVMPPGKGVTLEQARAVKEEVLRVFRKIAPVVGVGITRMGDGYGVKVNLGHQPDPDLEAPSTLNGVPLRIEVVGTIRKR